MLTVPGSRVSVRLPRQAKRVGRGYRYRFERAGEIEVWVAEATVGPGTPPDLDAALADKAGVGPDVPLVEDPPGSGRWRNQPEPPSQIRLRQLRAGTAAAAVMVGVQSRRDLDVADRILDSATLDPAVPYEPARLVGIEVEAPVGTAPVSVPGPVVMLESTNPAIDGGLTVGWVPAGIEIDDDALQSSLRDLLATKTSGIGSTLERTEHGGLRGWVAEGEDPSTGPFYLATLAVPGETDGLFMVHASARGNGAEALMRVMVSAARAVRVVDGETQ